jgi:hypothetical protein
VAAVRLTSRQLAARWGKGDGVIRMMRVNGKGPKVHYDGRRGRGRRPRIYYLLSEVEAFENKYGRPV